LYYPSFRPGRARFLGE